MGKIDSESDFFRPYFEYTIYVPQSKLDPDFAGRIADECGGCTVTYACGGVWLNGFNEPIQEPVVLLSAIHTDNTFVPLTFLNIRAELLEGGESAVLITRRPVEALGI